MSSGNMGAVYTYVRERGMLYAGFCGAGGCFWWDEYGR